MAWINWIYDKDRPWNCKHVNKCVILYEDNNGELHLYNTDWPEPEKPYKYFFMTDLLEGYHHSPNRKPSNCDCK